MKRFSWALFLLLILTAGAEAATIYVDNGSSGCSNPDNDYNPATRSCGSGSSTVHSTIQAGALAINSGDTLRIRDGVYDEQPRDWFPSGTSSNRTIIEGDGLSTIIRPNSSKSGHTMAFTNIDFVTFKKIAVDSLDRAGAGGVVGVGSTGTSNHLVFEDCEVKNSSGFAVVNVQGGSTGWTFRRCKIHGQGGAGGVSTLIYMRGSFTLWEFNEIYDGFGSCLLLQFNDPPHGTDNIVRWNRIHDCGTAGEDENGAINDNDHNSLVMQNLLYNNRDWCLTAQTPRNTRRHYNNVMFNCGTTGAIRYKGLSSNIEARNNIIFGGITNTGTNNSIPTNLNLVNPNASTTFVNAAAGDFRLKSGSPAIDTGVNLAGLTCVGNCDHGVYEALKFNSCHAAGNTLSILFDSTRFPPLTNLATTGITATIDGSGRTLSSPTLVGSNQVNFTFSGGAVASTAATIGSSIAITDSAKIANIPSGQGVINWSSSPCNVTGGGSAVLTQTYFRGHDLPGTESSPLVLRAVNQNFTIQRGGCFRCRVKIACTGGDCLPFAPVWRYKKNAGSFTPVPNDFTGDNFKYYGTADTSPDVPTHLSPTPSELLTSDHGSNIPGTFLRSDDSVPNVDLSQNSEIELEGMFCIDRDEAVGTTFQLQIHKGDGTALDSYPGAGTPTITVVAPGAYQMGLGPRDIEISLGSELRAGIVRNLDGSLESDVPKSVRVIQ